MRFIFRFASPPTSSVRIFPIHRILERKIYTVKPVPFSIEDLYPSMSATAFAIHFLHHHNQIALVNKLVEDTNLKNKSFEEVLKETAGSNEEKKKEIHFLLSDIYSHEFFFKSLIPGGKKPTPRMEALLSSSFNMPFDNILDKFFNEATGIFGNGWIWIVEKDGKLILRTSFSVDGTLTSECNPILGLDLWEHSYLYDYNRDIKAYIKGWWNLINWEFVESRIPEILFQKETEIIKGPHVIKEPQITKEPQKQKKSHNQLEWK